MVEEWGEDVQRACRAHLPNPHIVIRGRDISGQGEKLKENNNMANILTNLDTAVILDKLRSDLDKISSAPSHAEAYFQYSRYLGMLSICQYFLTDDIIFRFSEMAMEYFEAHELGGLYD